MTELLEGIHSRIHGRNSWSSEGILSRNYIRNTRKNLYVVESLGTIPGTISGKNLEESPEKILMVSSNGNPGGIPAKNPGGVPGRILEESSKEVPGGISCKKPSKEEFQEEWINE